MTNYNVDVSYLERILDTLVVDVDDREQAEFEAMNQVRDKNPDASNVEVLNVVEIE